jgi:hypothetical protein
MAAGWTRPLSDPDGVDGDEEQMRIGDLAKLSNTPTRSGRHCEEQG